MRQRSISSIGVVIVGLVPAFMGVPVFAPVFTLLALVGVSEFHTLARPIGRSVIPIGFVVVPLYAIAAAWTMHEEAVLGVAALAVGVPFVVVILREDLLAPSSIGLSLPRDPSISASRCLRPYARERFPGRSMLHGSIIWLHGHLSAGLTVPAVWRGCSRSSS